MSRDSRVGRRRWMRPFGLRAPVVCVLALASGVSAALAGPVTVETIDRQTPGGPIRGFVAVVDLSDPRVEIVVTAPKAQPQGLEATRVATDAWQQSVAATLAVNANFFAAQGASEADVIGSAISEGRVVSPARTFNGVPDPAVLFFEDGTAEAARVNPATRTGVLHAVAGVGGSTTDSDPGTLLVTDGVNTGATARVQPSVRNPRTAVGVSADGKTLVVMVIDGRQPGFSVGVTLPELADLMIEFGADDAVNLDGGGSSSFLFDDGKTTYENSPSDGFHRPVANHLGVRVKGAMPLPAEDKRPIRGVWYRPPTSLSTLQTTINQVANAGIQDLFLETFYWGLATNDSDVFADRFAFDYLEEAIRIASSQGVRVHAWLEAAYWSFGGTGDYILNQHPEWKVVDVYGNTNIGDIPGQIFVNLGNPGVQAMLADYCAELSSEYPGLWGVHTDYHRFPLDNNTGDSQPAPYSYDAWSRSAFMAETGADPLFTASNPASPRWAQFVEFRRRTVAESAGAMQAAIEGADPGMLFSGAIFATAVTSSSQLVKMQDWPRMAANGWLPVVVPMAYGQSTTSIRNDLRSANEQKGPAEVVAGLAILTNITRPSITQQLQTAYGEDIPGFIFFEASVIAANQGRQTELRNYLLANGPFQTADFDQDGFVDANDWASFELAYSGTPVVTPGGFEPFDINADGWLDSTDEARFFDQFRRFRFGVDGVVNEKDLVAFDAVFTGPGNNLPVFGRLALFDLDGDGDVDEQDRLRLHTLLTAPVPPLVDLNADGLADTEDLYEFARLPRDVNRDGVIDDADRTALEAVVRFGELEDMNAGRR